MTWTLNSEINLSDGVVRWQVFGKEGSPTVLVHGTPYSSFMWRDIAVGLQSQGRMVYVFDHLGYGQSDKCEGQDLTLAAQGRRFAEILCQWNLRRPSIVACDIGGAIVLRTLLLEGVEYSDLTLFDAVTGGRWEAGLFGLIRRHHNVFEQMPGYAHKALVTAHLCKATYQGYKPGVLEHYLAPWLGNEGQAAFYRQYRQLSEDDTIEYERLIDKINIPLKLMWGRNDNIVPAEFATWIESRTSTPGIVWIENAGHLLAEDAPAQLLAHLTRTSQ